jgi:transposase
MRGIEQTGTAQNGKIVFVSMELSKASWLLAAQGSPSGKASSHKLEGGDTDGLLALLRRLQAREQRGSGEEVQIVLGYEAGYDGFWLQRRLTAEGITCWVMDPGSLQVDRRARRARVPRRPGRLSYGSGALGGARGRASHSP